MPEMPDVISGEPVDSAWGNDIRDRTAQRYADAVDRDALVPLPVAGDLAFLDDIGAVTVFDGVAWHQLLDSEGGYVIGPGLVDIERTSSGMIRFTRTGTAPGNVGRLTMQISGAALFDLADSDGAGVITALSLGRTASTFNGDLNIAGDLQADAMLSGGARFVNSQGDPSGFIEPFPGAGRQILRIGSGVDSGTADETFLQLTGINDSGGIAAFAVRHGGVASATFRADAVFMEPVQAATTGDAANVVVFVPNGQLVRSTSARKYKSNIEPADHLADTTLQPVTFDHEGGGSFVGFIADDIAAQVPDAGVFAEGDIENYDLRAVVAILAAKVNRLEAEADA